jgi:proteasome inhibitor subunit 1 (PI31)
LDDEIFSKLSSPSTQSTQSQSKSNASQQQKERPVEGRPDPLRIEDPRQPFLGYSPFYEEQRFPPPIGGADLDPLGRGVGGMLMDPRNLIPAFGRGRNPAPDLPRGAVPPGARFDPFNPPGVGPDPNRNPRNPRNPGPGPDHLPPPPFGYDDMFM